MVNVDRLAKLIEAGGSMRARQRARIPPGLAGLDLTPEQERAARALMEKRRPEMEAVLRETFPRFEAIRRQFEADLRPSLTEAQARKLDAHRPEPPPGQTGPPADAPPR
jgi:hypothetical protein